MSAEDCDRDGIIKSKSSTKSSHVRFTNKTARKVDVIWINYEGVRVKYKTLEPNEFYDVTSFVTHPWIFRDSELHTNLVVNSKEVFDCPEQLAIRKGSSIRPIRNSVIISLPLFPLRECAIQTVQRALNDPKDAFKLELPGEIQKELYRRCNFKNNGNPSRQNRM